MSRPPHLRRGAPLRNRGQKERAVGGAERSHHILLAPPFSLTFSCAGNCSHRTPQLEVPPLGGGGSTAPRPPKEECRTRELEVRRRPGIGYS
jgi:hypothetical protein